MSEYEGFNPEEEANNVFSPETMANPDYSPFYQEGNIDIEGKKFVELDGQELQKLAQQKGIELSEEQRENGIILIGEGSAMSERHVDLLKRAFNLEDTTDIVLSNAGTIMNPTGNPENIYVTQYSADLNIRDKSGQKIPHRKLNAQQMVEQHANTAQKLNKIYEGQFNFVPVDLMS